MEAAVSIIWLTAVCCSLHWFCACAQHWCSFCRSMCTWKLLLPSFWWWAVLISTVVVWRLFFFHFIFVSRKSSLKTSSSSNTTLCDVVELSCFIHASAADLLMVCLMWSLLTASSACFIASMWYLGRRANFIFSLTFSQFVCSILRHFIVLLLLRRLKLDQMSMVLNES